MPAWRQGMAVGEWRALSSSALSSAPMAVQTYPTLGTEGPSSKGTQWTGFAVDTRDSSVYSVANGGHHGYAGNEVNRIRLTDSVPAWTEVRSSTPPAQVIDSSNYYADGRPTSRHTFYGSFINEKLNRAMVVNGSQYGNGYGISTVDGFNLAASDWDGAGKYASTPSALTQVMGAAMALDKATGDVYAFGWSTMHRWTAATNTWTTKSTAYNGQSAASAVDTKRNRILLVGGYGAILATYDIAAGTMKSITLSGVDAASIGGQSNALVYDPLQDAFLFRKDDAGADVYRINAQTFAVDKQPASSAGSQIPAAVNGVWGKFLYVPALKGVVYLPTFESNLWFLRTF